ncbi:hypothetical protein [Streptomyces sp. NPDC054961]
MGRTAYKQLFTLTFSAALIGGSALLNTGAHASPTHSSGGETSLAAAAHGKGAGESTSGVPAAVKDTPGCIAGQSLAPGPAPSPGLSPAPAPTPGGR